MRDGKGSTRRLAEEAAWEGGYKEESGEGKGGTEAEKGTK